MIPLHQTALSRPVEMCSVPLEDKGWELRELDQPASEVLLLEGVLVGQDTFPPWETASILDGLSLG